MSGEFRAGERGWAAAAHLSPMIPFGYFFGALVIWLLKRNAIPFVGEQAKESMNFQITIAGCAVLLLLIDVLLIVDALWITDFLMLLLLGASPILMIIAAVRSYRGAHYRYPLTLRVIR